MYNDREHNKILLHKAVSSWGENPHASIGGTRAGRSALENL